MADALRQEPGVEVELVNGNRGEFSVLMDGKLVAKKRLVFTPSVDKVVKAVREEASGEGGS